MIKIAAMCAGVAGLACGMVTDDVLVGVIGAVVSFVVGLLIIIADALQRLAPLPSVSPFPSSESDTARDLGDEFAANPK